MRSIAKISAATLALLLASAGAASADESTEDTLRVTVNGGALSVSMDQAPEIITDVPAAGGSVVEAPMAVTVTDTRGNGAGWNVYQNLDAINYNGPVENALNPLTTEDVMVTRMDSLTDMGLAAGSPARPANMPSFMGMGDLSMTKGLLEALPGTGMGSFQANFSVAMNVPSTVLAGEYAGQLTTTVVSGSL